MYCNRCGGVLSAGAQACPACGERVAGGNVVTQPVAGRSMSIVPSGRVQRHIGLLAALWMINGVLRLLEVCAFTFVGHLLLPGIFGSNHWGVLNFPFRWSFWPMSMGLAWIAVLLGVFGVIHLVLAWGLYERKVWARPLGLVIGFLALVRFPLGTALGAYTIWVLLPEVSAREFEQIAVQ
jgi:Predicted membrane protein (DUF2127)